MFWRVRFDARSLTTASVFAFHFERCDAFNWFALPAFVVWEDRCYVSLFSTSVIIPPNVLFF